MVDLFEQDKSVISRHINNVFKEKELNRNSVVAKNATTVAADKIYQVEYFNLDVIISVGYRIKSRRATQFRIWANKILKEYLIKGYSLNEKRLEQKTEQLKKFWNRSPATIFLSKGKRALPSKVFLWSPYYSLLRNDQQKVLHKQDNNYCRSSIRQIENKTVIR